MDPNGDAGGEKMREKNQSKETPKEIGSETAGRSPLTFHTAELRDPRSNNLKVI